MVSISGLLWMILVLNECSHIRAEEIGKEIVVDDMIVKTKATNNKSRSIAENEILWNDQTVPYEIDPKMPTFRANLIHRAIKEFQYHTCLKIVPRTYQRDYIFIIAAELGVCTSEIGMNGGKQVLEHGCGLSDFMHEFMHALGFLHENDRADRNHYISIHMENVKPEPKEVAFARATLLGTVKLHPAFKHFPYDYRSLMHYIATTSAQEGKKTITINDPRYKHLEDLMGNERGLSTCDVYKINYAYKCRTYKRRERNRLCIRKVHRYSLISCPPEDPYPWCQGAIKDPDLCRSRPGHFLLNCPVACNNCEGASCNDTPYEHNIIAICQKVKQKIQRLTGRKYECEDEEWSKCPLSCGLC